MESNNSDYTDKSEVSAISNNYEDKHKTDEKEVETVNSDECQNTEYENKQNAEQFKKPNLIIGPRKGKASSVRGLSDKISQSEKSEVETESAKKSSTSESKQLPLAYKEPTWAGIPTGRYKIEVLKSGVILEIIDLSDKSFHVIGRLPVCDIPLAHPTISRYHAILQYRVQGDEENEPGYYLYDLESTHGTFWNGSRIRPNTYVRLRGGHMIKLGCSQRKFILQTPANEEEEESEYSLTELREIRRLQLLEKEQEANMQNENVEEEQRKENEGIDWGMGEDADEESDSTENPYAMTNNEELFLHDPKKTLRGWFEREGHDLQYQVDEKGIGQFLCYINLPIDTSSSRTVRAEALVKGKKKEAVIQCAIEACKILDRYGLLRQATHEGRKRKSRNWEEEDYYDSDEDNFLDRTGTVERKRAQRMRNAGKLDAAVETYDTLIDKHVAVVGEIERIETTLKNHHDAQNNIDSNSSVDALDAFMSNLNSAVLNKNDVGKLKFKLQGLRKDEENFRKLINIAKPANLPALNPRKCTSQTLKSTDEVKQVSKKSHSSQSSKDHKDFNLDVDSEGISKKKRYGLIKTSEVQNEMDKDVEKDNIFNESSDCNDDCSEIEKVTTEDNDKIDDKNEVPVSESELMKKKKKNIRRAQQRADKAAKMPSKSNQDEFRENYSTWLPPENQTGDGKTTLNEKFGY